MEITASAPVPIISDSAMLAKLDAIHSILQTAAAALGGTGAGAGPSIGQVNVTIQGNTNMSKADLQAAVTDGLVTGYNQLRALRQIVPS
jgi:hypothetical protein